MRSSEEYFHASDGGKILLRVWEPAEGMAPQGVVQCHHGLAEHSRRYAGLAAALTAKGYIVLCHDNRSHGLTGQASGKPLGYHGADFVQRMRADLSELLLASRKRWPGLRLFLFGHSMGANMSYILLGGGGVPGVDLSGAILMCPSARLPKLGYSVLPWLLALLKRRHGPAGFSPFVDNMVFGGWQAKVAKMAKIQPSEATPNWDWLNRDRVEMQKYLDDPFCGHPTSLASWESMLDDQRRLLEPETMAKFPEGLPLLLLLGEQDPTRFNDLNATVEDQTATELGAVGRPSPKVIVYPGARHELLVELNKDEVFEDVLHFLKQCSRRVPRSRL